MNKQRMSEIRQLMMVLIKLKKEDFKYVPDFDPNKDYNDDDYVLFYSAWN